MAFDHDYGPVLVRHGEKLICNGIANDDLPLSERGQAQAEQLAAQLAGRRFDVLYTSPRLRARQTAAIIGEHLGLEPIVHHELRNVPNGPLSLLSLFEVPPFARRELTNKRALVITHGGTMLLLLATLGDWRHALRRPQRIPHCQPFACPPDQRDATPAMPRLAPAGIGPMQGAFNLTPQPPLLRREGERADLIFNYRPSRQITDTEANSHSGHNPSRPAQTPPNPERNSPSLLRRGGRGVRSQTQPRGTDQPNPERVSPSLPRGGARGVRSTSFFAPLLLLLTGMALALLTTPGVMPGIPLLASLALAAFAYWATEHLARNGKASAVVAALVLAALLLVPLAFGPSTQNNRKILPFNTWAYDLGALLPALPTPPPNPNGVAAFLAVALALAAGATIVLRGKQRQLALLALPLLAAGLFLTASRAGWLAGLAAVVFLARGHLLRYARMFAAPAGIILLIVLPVLGAAEEGQPAIISPASMIMRAEQWTLTAELIERHPLTGIGPGRFAPAYAELAAAGGVRPYKTPNNTLLEIWIDAGLLGLAAIAWIVARITAFARQTRANHPASWLREGILAALIAFAVHGLFETNTAIVWASSGGYGYLASPLLFALLGLLAGVWWRGNSPAGEKADANL